MLALPGSSGYIELNSVPSESVRSIKIGSSYDDWTKIHEDLASAVPSMARGI